MAPNLQALKLRGLTLVTPDFYPDARGFFLETYQAERYREGGIAAAFVQDNHSRSTRGVLRGLHYQVCRAQGKLVFVARGEIFDVAVDLRKGSPTYGQWEGVHLSEENHRQLYVPPGFAHGFCVLSDVADVIYKCTEYYDRSRERGVRWNDPDLGIAWPLHEPSLSPRDGALPWLREIPPSDLPGETVG